MFVGVHIYVAIAIDDAIAPARPKTVGKIHRNKTDKNPICRGQMMHLGHSRDKALWRLERCALDSIGDRSGSDCLDGSDDRLFLHGQAADKAYCLRIIRNASSASARTVRSLLMTTMAYQLRVHKSLQPKVNSDRTTRVC